MQEPPFPPEAPTSFSLFVALHRLGRPDARLRRIAAKLPQRPALAQEIPAQIELDLDLLQALAVGVRELPLSIELVLFLHELFDMLAYRLVGFRSEERRVGKECRSRGS